MKKESMQEVLNQMTPKQLEGLRFLTESGRLEDLVKDLVANLELTTTSKSTKTEAVQPQNSTQASEIKSDPFKEDLIRRGFSPEEAEIWLQTN